MNAKPIPIVVNTQVFDFELRSDSGYAHIC